MNIIQAIKICTLLVFGIIFSCEDPIIEADEIRSLNLNELPVNPTEINLMKQSQSNTRVDFNTIIIEHGEGLKNYSLVWSFSENFLDPMEGSKMIRNNGIERPIDPNNPTKIDAFIEINGSPGSEAFGTSRNYYVWGKAMDRHNKPKFSNRLAINTTPRFNIDYGSSNLSGGERVVQLSGNSYAVVGNNKLSSGNLQPYLIFIDEFGNIQNRLDTQLVLSSPTDPKNYFGDEIVDMIKLNNGNLAMIGTTFDSPSETEDIYFLEVEPSGNVKGKQAINNHLNYDFGTALVQDGISGAIYILGHTIDPVDYDSDLFLIERNLSGGMVKLEINLPGGPICEEGVDLSIVNNDFVGIIGSTTTDYINYESILVKVKLPSLDLMTTNPIQVSSIPGLNTNVCSITHIGAKEFMLAGTPTSSTSKFIYLWHINEDGFSMEGYPKKLDVAPGGNASVNYSFQSIDGNIMLLGEVNEDAAAIKYSLSVQDSIWMETYPRAGIDFFLGGNNSVADSGFIAVGALETAPKSLIILKADAEGKY